MNASKEQRYIDWLKYALENWSDIEVKAVPGVMYQVCCGIKDGVEYRFNWFLYCSETYIHNHRYTFDSYCIEGSYLEKLWQIVSDDTGSIVYRFGRRPGNQISSPRLINGTLSVIATRFHFPGNILHVDRNLFHTISPIHHSSNQVFTFVSREITQSSTDETYILSDVAIIEAPIEKHRPATQSERDSFCQKIQELYASSVV